MLYILFSFDVNENVQNMEQPMTFTEPGLNPNFISISYKFINSI
jgi:hypothetical protein